MFSWPFYCFVFILLPLIPTPLCSSCSSIVFPFFILLPGADLCGSVVKIVTYFYEDAIQSHRKHCSFRHFSNFCPFQCSTSCWSYVINYMIGNSLHGLNVKLPKSANAMHYIILTLHYMIIQPIFVFFINKISHIQPRKKASNNILPERSITIFFNIQQVCFITNSGY